MGPQEYREKVKNLNVKIAALLIGAPLAVGVVFSPFGRSLMLDPSKIVLLLALLTLIMGVSHLLGLYLSRLVFCLRNSLVGSKAPAWTLVEYSSAFRFNWFYLRRKLSDRHQDTAVVLATDGFCGNLGDLIEVSKGLD